MNLSNGKDLTANSVTQLNSAYKDLFAGIHFSGKLGSSVQIYFSFMTDTFENHNKS